MTATAHTLVGAAIASKIPDPLIFVPLCLIGHFIMDSIPHWDIGTNWRHRPKYVTGVISIAETLTGIIVSFLLFRNTMNNFHLVLAIVFSILPDWLEIPWYIFFARPDKKVPAKNASFWEKLTFKIYKTENIFHSKTDWPLGIITQVVTVGFFLIITRN